MPGPVTWVRGIVCCMLLVFSGTFGCSFVMTPVMLLKLISPRWYNAAISRCLDSFNTFCSIVSHYVVGYRMRITADNAQHGAVTTDETALLIFNHRSEIDWLSFFEWSYFQGGAAKAIKIVLKRMLMRAPGLGWCMHGCDFPFVARKWEDDKETLTHCANVYAERGVPSYFLIYPEGTALYSRTLDRNQKWMTEHGKTPYKYVLMPRDKGFTHLLRCLGPKTAVYDFTLAFPSLRKGKRPLPIDMINGNWPVTHMHVRRYGPEELPTSSEDLKAWLEARWDEKEERLRKYYEEAPPAGMPDGGFEGVEVQRQASHPLWYFVNFVVWVYGIWMQFVWLWQWNWLGKWHVVCSVAWAVKCWYDSRRVGQRKKF